MRFTKMQGCGNDYIYVDCFVNKPPANAPALSRQISDRHFGVGADGLILICPSEKADARMIMFNADGSESEMCGNGIRCVAKYVHDHGIARKPTLTIETGRGVLTLDLETRNGKVEQVCVNMGEPILESARIPTTLPGNPPIDLQLPGFDFRATCVSMGNPHCIIFVDEITKDHIHGIGPVIEKADLFPRKTNVEFVKVNRPDDLTMRVWERGSGETLACGTGASAVCVAGVLTGRSQRKVTIHLLGGDLMLHWREADNRVYMTGPAVEVFTGVWDGD
ncbi:MAG: diaminopimelate epimerase [Planctomycetes bacterium]|nr:diaminopimelate epimerase [Planctomycetota bacterium]